MIEQEINLKGFGMKQLYPNQDTLPEQDKGKPWESFSLVNKRVSILECIIKI